MTNQKIKTILLNLLGENVTSFIQAFRFVWLIKKRSKFDYEMGLINYFVKKGDTVIDIGANGADWTHALYEIVTEEGKIFAFEADPYYAKATSLAIKLLGFHNVILFPFGLSDKKEESYLKVLDINGQRYTGSSFIDKSAKTGTHNYKQISLEKLDSVALIYPDINRTSFIKCDVEGYELFVFKGAEKVITKSRPCIIIEVDNFEKHDYSVRDIFGFFSGLNYSSYTCLKNRKITLTDKNFYHENSVSQNRILIPNEKIQKFENIIE